MHRIAYSCFNPLNFWYGRVTIMCICKESLWWISTSGTATGLSNQEVFTLPGRISQQVSLMLLTQGWRDPASLTGALEIDAKQPTLAENATGAEHLGTLSHCQHCDRYCIRPRLCSCVPCIHINCVSGCCWSPRAITYQHVFLRPHSDSSTCCSAAYIYNLHALAALPFLTQHGLVPASEENCCGGLASSLTPCKNFSCKLTSSVAA